jgi:phage repressor protein C with HTH and peptisase S24 domain
MFSHDRIWAAIDALAERHRLSPSGLARRAGLDPTSFNKSKRLSSDGRLRWPSTESIAKVLDAMGATIDEFIGLQTSDGRSPRLAQSPSRPQENPIPLLGFAQAGDGGFFDDGGFPAGQGWDVVDFPVSPERKAGVYALEVQGESMMPLYRDGDVLIVEPRRSDGQDPASPDATVDRAPVAEPRTSEPFLRHSGRRLDRPDYLGEPMMRRH